MKKTICILGSLAVASLAGVFGHPPAPAAAAVLPSGYTWHTFYGAAGEKEGDSANATVTDAAGNVYIVGESDASWNGPAGQAPLHAHAGGVDPSGDPIADIVVVKLSSNGAYRWHTFYGGSGSDWANGIAIDAAGNIVVVGESWAAWNGPGAAAPLHGYASKRDVVVLKLSAAGAYQWHTFRGYDQDEYANDVAVDASGGIYVVGNSYAAWDPGDGTPLHAYGEGGDLFVLKLSAAGAYQWHTFHGSSGGEYAYGIAHHDGALYLAGSSQATWLGPASEAPLHPHAGGGGDCLALKLGTDGSYLWHAFYGAELAEDCNQVAAATGGVYLIGQTAASWNGPGDLPPIQPYQGSGDIQVLALTSAGAYQWHTFLGAPDYRDHPGDVAVDAAGGLCVGGGAEGSWSGPAGQSPLHAHSGATDVQAVKLTSAGAYLWHTFLGSGEEDFAAAVAIDPAGGVILVGGSDATWLGPAGQAPLNPAGRYDIAVAKIVDGVHTATFRSAGGQDGWVLESAETSGKGGTLNVAATTFRLGDDALDRQYRAVLSFDTAPIPDGAAILSAEFKARFQGKSGTSPFTTHGALLADLSRNGFAGNPALQLIDFQAVATLPAAFTVKSQAVGGWHTGTLGSTARNALNKAGLSQVRLRFQKDDNDDRSADWASFYSGEAPLASRPVLEVRYRVP